MAARDSQLPVEAVVAPTSQSARDSQLPVEAVIAPTSQSARDSQLVVEVVLLANTVARTASDTITTVTESVSRAAGTYARAYSDTLATLTDVATIPGDGHSFQADAFQNDAFETGTTGPISRTASDTLTLSDSVSRAAAVKTRTASDTLATLTDTVTKGVQARTATDTVALTESVSRVANKPRTASDTIPALTESLSPLRARDSQLPVEVVIAPTSQKVRISQAVVEAVLAPTILSRTLSDTVTTSDSLVRAAAVKTRTSSDTIATLTDTVVKGLHTRVITDTFPALTESVSRAAGTWSRALSDTITLTETLNTRRDRTATDTLSALTDAVTRTTHKARTLSDTIAITDAVVRQSPLIEHRTAHDVLVTSDRFDRAPVGSFTQTVTTTHVSEYVQFTDTSSGAPTTWLWDFGDGTTSTLQNPSHVYTAIGTYTVSLTVSNPAGSSNVTHTNLMSVAAQLADRVIVISYDGTPITPEVLFARSSFITKVNGIAGSAEIWFRDDSLSTTFEIGKDLTLDIDGSRVWTGYVERIRRAYAFADSAGVGLVSRFLVIDGADINILFRKRVVFNQATPTDVEGKTYPKSPPTKDITAIQELLANYLDLSGDNLDTTSMVQNVADINVDQEVNVFAGGWYWADAMNTIKALPGAVYYIDPDRRFVYSDDETVDAAFELSDTPTAGQVGYRQMEIVETGTNLINDFLAWGAGFGSRGMVFDRVTDAASVAAHGLWQDGVLNQGVYKQATIDRIADSVVNGSPSHHRGHKDDIPSIIATVYEPSFRAGQKVHFLSNTFGYDIVLPIRQMTMTFPTTKQVKFDLVLSREPDDPWSFFDNYYQPYPNPLWHWPGIDWPPPWVPPVIERPCQDCEFGFSEVAGGPFQANFIYHSTVTGAAGGGTHITMHALADRDTQADAIDPTRTHYFGSEVDLLWTHEVDPTPFSTPIELWMTLVWPAADHSSYLDFGFATSIPGISAMGIAFNGNKFHMGTGGQGASGVTHDFAPGEIIVAELKAVPTSDAGGNYYIVSGWVYPQSVDKHTSPRAKFISTTTTLTPGYDVTFEGISIQMTRLPMSSTTFFVPPEDTWEILSITSISGVDCTELCAPCTLTTFGDWQVSDSLSQELVYDDAGVRTIEPSGFWTYGYGEGRIHADKSGGLGTPQDVPDGHANGGGAAISLLKEIADFDPATQAALTTEGTWALPYAFHINGVDNFHIDFRVTIEIEGGSGQSVSFYLEKGDFTSTGLSYDRNTQFYTRLGTPAGSQEAVINRGDSGTMTLQLTKSNPGFDSLYRGDVLATVGAATLATFDSHFMDPALVHRVYISVFISNYNSFITEALYLPDFSVLAGPLSFTMPDGSDPPWCSGLVAGDGFGATVSEILTPSGAVIRTGTSYLPGSPQVYLNGALALPSTYTETNPVAGIITMDVPIAEGVVVVVKYMVFHPDVGTNSRGRGRVV